MPQQQGPTFEEALGRELLMRAVGYTALQQRVAQLEAQVAELEQQLEAVKPKDGEAIT